MTIRLALQLRCDVCEEASTLKDAPELLVRLTRESIDGLARPGLEEDEAVVTRAAELSFAAIRATESLPPGWTRDLIDGWPWLVCDGCVAVGARAESLPGVRLNSNDGGA